MTFLFHPREKQKLKKGKLKRSISCFICPYFKSAKCNECSQLLTHVHLGGHQKYDYQLISILKCALYDKAKPYLFFSIQSWPLVSVDCFKIEKKWMINLFKYLKKKWKKVWWKVKSCTCYWQHWAAQIIFLP